MGIEGFKANRTGFFLTRLDDIVNKAANWGREYSLWPYPFATACCGIEFMGVVSNVHDISRFGAEVVRFSPRQSDLLVVAGTITHKMAPILKKIWNQMLEPKWCIALECAPQAAVSMTTMPWSGASITSSRWISTCPDVLPGQRPSSRP